MSPVNPLPDGTPHAFAFGRNWKEFNKQYLSDEKVGLLAASLQSFLRMTDLKGKSFLDVGCGSGIASLAALRLGATNIVSFDRDHDSVSCTAFLRQEAGSPQHWKVLEGSVLDASFVASLPKSDVVYAWGVLHHTGKMWDALENTLRLVKDGGLLYLAIYNKADGMALYPDGRFGPSSMWKGFKRFYSSLPWVFQNLIDACVMSTLVILYLLTLRNPVTVIRGHKGLLNRGMSWRIDIKDWLGGYPYEYATVAEIFMFARDRGFSLENLTCTNGLLNNEFLLKKKAL